MRAATQNQRNVWFRSLDAELLFSPSHTVRSAKPSSSQSDKWLLSTLSSAILPFMRHNRINRQEHRKRGKSDIHRLASSHVHGAHTGGVPCVSRRCGGVPVGGWPIRSRSPREAGTPGLLATQPRLACVRRILVARHREHYPCQVRALNR